MFCRNIIKGEEFQKEWTCDKPKQVHQVLSFCLADPGISVEWLGYGLDFWGVAFSKAIIPVTVPTQSFIQWVPVTVSPGVKRPICKFNHYLPSSAEVNNPSSFYFMVNCLIKHKEKLTYLSSFLVTPLLPTHCRCIGLFLHLMTFGDTHTHTHTYSVRLLWTKDRAFAGTSTWQHTIFTRDRHPCPWRDSNPQYQQASGRRPTP
jgi:hypothetical protein